MTYNPRQAKDGLMAHEGGDPWMHHDSKLHDQSGKKRESAPGVDPFDKDQKDLEAMNRGDMTDIYRKLGSQGMSREQIDEWYGKLK